jgi:hypothetical protein
VAQARLVRLVVIVIGIWIAVGLIAVVLFHSGGTHPPSRGKGEPIGLSPAR